jgi:hypothetical protein
MNEQSEHLQVLQNKDDEELIRLFNNEINLKKEIGSFVKASNISIDELNKLMIAEYRKTIAEFIETNANHKQYAWSVVIERIRKNILVI